MVDGPSAGGPKGRCGEAAIPGRVQDIATKRGVPLTLITACDDVG